MSFSPSDRRVLHWVPGSPWARDGLARALAEAAPGDVVLLLQDAVVAALADARLPAALDAALGTRELAVCAADLAARGLAGAPLRAGARAIDDAGMVVLAAACDVSCTWA
jgi:tRNA 2-thiouridine synthesizing protein B